MLYVRLVEDFGNPPPIRRIRRQLIPEAEGVVLEIGAGSGHNFAYYDPTRVDKLYALEPEPKMRNLARRRLPAGVEIEFIELPGERIPLADRSVDTAVSSFTLCTISGVEKAVCELRRVLRPSGHLLFFELGIAPGAGVRSLQRLLEPAAIRLLGGLRLTRDIPEILKSGGFTMRRIDSGYVAPFPRAFTYCWWGIAALE